MKIPNFFNVCLYLHAVKDSKVCYRISSLYGALPVVDLAAVAKDPINGKKRKVTIKTSKAHRTFRKKLGYNDQSDAKRTRLGLSGKYYYRWPHKPFAKN